MLLRCTKESLRSHKPGLTVSPVTESLCADLCPGVTTVLCAPGCPAKMLPGALHVSFPPPSFNMGEEHAFKMPQDYQPSVRIAELP